MTNRATVPKTSLPLFESVAARLRADILSGLLKPGVQMAPEPDLARDFGVSRETLRRSLAILEHQRLLLRRRGKGTFVNNPGRKAGITYRIGSLGLVPQHDPVYLGPLLNGLQEALGAAADVEFVFGQPPDGTWGDFCQANRLDGVVVYNPPIASTAQLDDPYFDEIPHVVVAASCPALLARNRIFVDTDNSDAADQVVRHLVALGHRRIAFLGDRDLTHNLRDRAAGYHAAMQMRGLTPIEVLVPIRDVHLHTEEIISATSAAASALLARHNRPTALFAAGALLSFGALHAARALGLRVPADLSVVGFDDPDAFAHLSPPLDTVRQPVRELGRTAGRMLCEQLLHGRTAKRQVILKNELIIRESSAEWIGKGRVPPRPSPLNKHPAASQEGKHRA